jgi:glycerol-3-phosphate dehydrogenase
VRLEHFLFAVFGWPLVHRAFYGAGLTLYDLLGAARDGGRSRHLGAGAVVELVPPIRRRGLRGGIVYSDAVEDDARLCLSVAFTAIDLGATAVTRMRATGLLTASDGAIRGVTARDLLGDADIDVRADHVIDATGVWLGHPEARLGGSTVKLVPSRGSHLVFERQRLPMSMGMTLRVPGRVLFVVPYPGAWIVGTTEEPDDGPPDRPRPSQGDVGRILETVNGVLDLDLAPGDAVGAYAGLRPLVGVPGTDPARVSREHTVRREASGLVRVSGGKYTTYRLMARDAVDVALEGRALAPPSQTGDLQLAGAAALPQLDALAARLAVEPGLDDSRAAALVARHGALAPDVVRLGRELDLVRPLSAEVPHLEAEVAWAVRRELALGLDDVLSRRMRLSMARRDRGATIAPRVAAIMAADLGWDAARQAAEVERYLVGARREYDVPGAGDPRATDRSDTIGPGGERRAAA